MKQFLIFDTEDNLLTTACPPYADAWPADDLIAYAAERTGKSIKYIILIDGTVRLIKGYQPPPKILTLPKDTGR